MLEVQPSRVERRKVRTRKALLDVSLELFYEKGIYWTKIEDITERADIGKGTFYQYFTTKEELLEVLLQQGLEALLTQTQTAITNLPHGRPLLTNIIQAQLDFHIEHKEYLLLFHQVRGLLQFTRESVLNLRKVYDDYLDELGNLITPAMTDKIPDSIPPREFAMAISAYTLGLLTHHLLFDQAGEFLNNRKSIQKQLEGSLQALLNEPTE